MQVIELLIDLASLQLACLMVGPTADTSAQVHTYSCQQQCGTAMSTRSLTAADACLQAFVKAIELLIDLASLQTAFLTLDAAIKTTNRRVNALDSVVKPRLENTISYIKARHAL